MRRHRTWRTQVRTPPALLVTYRKVSGYIRHMRWTTSICSSVLRTASLFWVSQGVYTDQNWGPQGVPGADAARSQPTPCMPVGVWFPTPWEALPRPGHRGTLEEHHRDGHTVARPEVGDGMTPHRARAGGTWPPTKPALSLGMLVCVPAKVVRLALSSCSRLLNISSSCQGRSLCLELAGERPGSQGGHWDLGASELLASGLLSPLPTPYDRRRTEV